MLVGWDMTPKGCPIIAQRESLGNGDDEKQNLTPTGSPIIRLRRKRGAEMKIIRLAIAGLCLLEHGALGVGTGNQVQLSDLQVEHVATGWGDVGVDRSVSGLPLRIGGEAFDRGLGVHAVSTIQVRLHGAATRFTAFVGVDDVMRGKGSIQFVVRGDGRMLWRSGLMLGGQAARRVDLPLAGVQLLELGVTDGGNGVGQDHANWAVPVISFAGKRPRIVPMSRPLSPCNREAARAALIPYPRSVEWLDGEADVSRYRVTASKRDRIELRNVAMTLRGIMTEVGATLDTKGGTPIVLALDADIEEKEAYRLAVAPGGIEIRAGTVAGIFCGVQTLRQLAGNGVAKVPCCRISDRPAFGLRGFMHDLGRNPQDIQLLKRFIDVMAQYKLNVFHMHLTDYPGYRIECRKYPELNDPKNYRQTRRPGFFYTYEQLNDIIKYCAARNIMVIPEIDMPGHSEYFKKTFGVDMQDPKGMQILSDVVNEFCDNVDLPHLHIGSDEVRVRNRGFMPHMVKLIRGRGKDVLVWRPGYLPDHDVITQLWTGAARPVGGVRYIDSQANYINHMDPFSGPLRAFMQQPCRVPERTDLALGGILCHWPDDNVGEQMNVYRQNPVMPALVAYAERIWRGAQNNREDAWAKLPEIEDAAFAEYEAFEADMLVHRDRYFKPWPFPYVKQTHIPWKLIGPFDHKGDTTAAFPVEEGIRDAYEADGKALRWRDAESRGGTIHVNHFFGFPGHLPKSGAGTVYAVTQIESPEEQDVLFWIGFNEISRSSGRRRGGPNPAQGQWSIVNSKVWVNGHEIPPPVWKQPGLSGSPEIPFVDENYFYREPVKIRLKKGVNTVLVKTPHAKPAWKWMFTCVPVSWDGKQAREVEGLRFSIPSVVNAD